MWQYAGQGIDDVEPTIDEHILNWIRCIDAHCLAQRRSSRAFDIGKSIQFLTVDLITQLCLGEAFGCVDSNRDQFDFLATVRTGSAISQHFSVLLEVNRLLFYLTKIPFLRRLLVPSVKDKTGVGKIMGVSAPGIAVIHLITYPHAFLRSFGILWNIDLGQINP